MTKKFRTLHKAKLILVLGQRNQGGKMRCIALLTGDWSAAEGHGRVAKGIALRSGCSFGFGALGQMSLLLDMVPYYWRK